MACGKIKDNFPKFSKLFERQGKAQVRSQPASRVNEANSMSPEIVMYRIFSAAKRECRVREGGGGVRASTHKI